MATVYDWTQRSNVAFDRSNPHLIAKAQLLGNDIDRQKIPCMWWQ